MRSRVQKVCVVLMAGVALCASAPATEGDAAEGGPQAKESMDAGLEAREVAARGGGGDGVGWNTARRRGWMCCASWAIRIWTFGSVSSCARRSGLGTLLPLRSHRTCPGV